MFEGVTMDKYERSAEYRVFPPPFCMKPRQGEVKMLNENEREVVEKYIEIWQCIRRAGDLIKSTECR